MTSVSTMDQCNNIIRNVHAISSTDNLDDLLKAVTYADLEAMKGEILNEVQSKLEMFRESLGIEKRITSTKSRAKKNSKLGQLNMNHDSYSAEKPFELNLESDTTTNETHLDVVVDSSTQTDLKGSVIDLLCNSQIKTTQVHVYLHFKYRKKITNAW